jgi:hypothetical protein
MKKSSASGIGCSGSSHLLEIIQPADSTGNPLGLDLRQKRKQPEGAARTANEEGFLQR